jgi:hypothetical protein
MFRIFEYCRYRAGPRVVQNDPPSIRAEFAQRAGDNGGKLFGCWRNMVGLGMSRDEGIAITAWPDEATARGAPAPGRMITGSESHIMEATIRPTDDSPPTYEGVYVFRWFDVPAADWQPFCDLSDAAWPNMEEVFDVNVCAFWRSLDIVPPHSKTLLLTRYGDLSVWEASRWWNNPIKEADTAMTNFRNRTEMVTDSIAYPTLPIF